MFLAAYYAVFDADGQRVGLAPIGISRHMSRLGPNAPYIAVLESSKSTTLVGMRLHVAYRKVLAIHTALASLLAMPR